MRVAVHIASESEICQGAALDCDQMSVSGRKGHYGFFLGAGARAKSVTNNFANIVRVRFRENLVTLSNPPEESYNYL